MDLSTHWGQVTHICVSKLTITGSDNGLWLGRRQAIIWTDAGIFLIRPSGANFSEILIEIDIFSFKKIHLKMSSGNGGNFVSASMSSIKSVIPMGQNLETANTKSLLTLEMSNLSAVSMDNNHPSKTIKLNKMQLIYFLQSIMCNKTEFIACLIAHNSQVSMISFDCSRGNFTIGKPWYHVKQISLMVIYETLMLVI